VAEGLEDSREQAPSHSGESAGGFMVGAILLSRLLGLLRDTVMTTVFGVGLTTDAYTLAIWIPDMLFMLIAGGGLSSAFIPVFSELLHTKREREAWRLFSVVVTVCSLAVAALIAAAWLAAPTVAHWLTASKVDSHGVNVSAKIEPLVVSMSRILLPAQFAFLIGSILLGTLYARRQFIAPGLAPNVYNLGIIIGAIVGGNSSLGIVGVPWGAMAGAVVGNLLIPIGAMTAARSHFRPSLDIHAPGVRKFFLLLAPVIIGFSLPSVCQMITTYFAAEYPAGVNTVLRLASALTQAPSGVVGQGLALAAFPVLTQFYANRRMEAYRAEFNKTLRTVIYVSVPAAAIMAAIAGPIIRMLYAYGRAKGSADLGEMATALRVYSLGVVPWSIQPVLMRGFFSAHKTLSPVALGSGVTLVFIAMCKFCTASHLSYLSLVWSTDIAAALLVIILFFALEREVGKLDRVGAVMTLAKAGLAAIVAGGVAFGVLKLFERENVTTARLALLLCILFTLCVAGWTFFYITRSLGMPETGYIERAASRFKRRR
jgi:putative peptidoglycan lipid II flippase